VLEIPLQAIRFKVSRFSSNGESINHKAISASKTYRWNPVAGLLVYGLLSKKVSNHLFHAFLRAAMGPEALLGPCPIKLLAQLLGNPAGEHDLAFPAGGAVALRRGHGYELYTLCLSKGAAPVT
jgi:hypothetical protein